MDNPNENIKSNSNGDFLSEINLLPLKEKLSSVPTKPGVYIYKNIEGKIIYVGKAKNLRNRVRSYFQQGRPYDAKTNAMLRKISDFEFIVTDSEVEALILEDTLIKENKPRYNIMLRDDKSYPYVRVTNEPYPRIFVTRKMIKDGSKYYGPFTDVGHLKRLMKTIRTIFLLRSCDYHITEETIAKNKYKICLDYHIKKCEGPCEGLISHLIYNEHVKQAIQVLNGKTRELEKTLEERMNALSEEMKFEEAAIIKNRYLILRDYLSHQKIVTTDIVDRDIIGLSRLDNSACTLILNIRDGKLISKRHFIIANAKDVTDENILETTIEKLYRESNFIPDEIYLQLLPDNSDFIENWLKELANKKVEIIIPKIGDKKKLLSMAEINAEYQLRDYQIALSKKEQSIPRTVLAIQRDLRLPSIPRRIECIDNSHIQGSELVSSVVVFVDGKPKKSDYRKFKIKTVLQNDDFAAMREVVRRRYTRILEEQSNENPTPFPDLLIIDGGKGQLSSAIEVLEELGINSKFVTVGLAKRLDEIFYPEKSDSLLLPKTSSSLKLIQQIRDEAHRFAITYHRLLRDKRTLQTELTNIPGIG
ncbi:MAG: excinuclease ABC subunit UvrC, partial [FCB group bacterium]